MNKRVGIFLCCWVISGLTSCNLPVRPNSGADGQEIIRQYQAISSLLTQTARPVSRQTVSPFGQAPNTALITSTPRPPHNPDATVVAGLRESTRTIDRPIGQLATAAPCNLAQPGRPFDISVPDDARFHPGEYFSKTWRLVNAGSCTWNQEYAVVLFSGDDMGVTQSISLNNEVAPGKSLDITIDMIAPQTEGTYQSNWKMRGSRGDLFGIGPNGDAPFWARIVVLPLDTPTATPPLPTPTPTPVIVASGPLVLLLGSGANLDNSPLSQAENRELKLQRSAEDILEVVPLGGVRLAYFGVVSPTMEECQLAPLSEAPLLAEQFLPGSYICYRTSQGLPGRLVVNSADLQKGRLEMEFVTWSVP